MSEPFVFDSRCELCKVPFGAVCCGSSVTVHVRPLGREGFTHCALVLREEFSGIVRELPLSFACWEKDRVRFDLTFSVPAAPELIWYHFRFWREDGSGCRLDRTGYRSDDGSADWQLTVFDNSKSTPSWFGAGVTYQIFPDRFCRLASPDPTGLIGNRTVHQNWSDFPEWQPDEAGEIRNRDFFGGSLAGITSKLDALAALSVRTIYLCPIFESASNHRYNTADYRKIDPMLGTEEDFRTLCSEAEKRGIHILLDGVFNHTGSQSRYFNADGFYPETGAAQSQDSPYYSWYHFAHWPDTYDAWWGIRTLPTVEESNPDYRDFIVNDEDSVIRHWLKLGASGWRLDVADELPDEFIADIRRAVDTARPDSLLLGEVWEDGSNKISYSRRRRYLLGNETHGLMNYPFRTAALAWLQGGDAADFEDAMETIREHYPPPAFYSAMNFLGTHDTARILTVLGARKTPPDRPSRAAYRLDAEEYASGKALLKVAAALLYAFPGSPTVFYGDETGMQGFEDPFNRCTYPWGQEDSELKAWFLLLGRLRMERKSLQCGTIRYLCAAGPGLAFIREFQGEFTLCVFNAGPQESSFSLPCSGTNVSSLLDHRRFPVHDGVLSLLLPSCSCLLLG